MKREKREGLDKFNPSPIKRIKKDALMNARGKLRMKNKTKK